MYMILLILFGIYLRLIGVFFFLLNEGRLYYGSLFFFILCFVFLNFKNIIFK